MSIEESERPNVARAEAIWSTAFRWGLAITVVQAVAAGYFAQAIWPQTHIALHWDIHGQVNRWGSGKEGAIVLMGMPVLSLFLVCLFRFLSKTGPRIEGMAATPRLFAAVFYGVPLLLLGVVALIGAMMMTGQPNDPSMWQVRAIFAASGVLVGGLGNFLGKTRRNWYIGIRTPWSLSSDLAWQKTNRVAGRFMVATGIVTLLLAAFGPPFSAAWALSGGSILMAIVAVYVSWSTWRADPNRTA